MEHFQIEEIIAQDTRGVVVRALIKSSGSPVAIRRFFPLGKEGEGLGEEESAAFVNTASRLIGLMHPALRTVIEGAVDPIDGMPYLVSEWIGGETLPKVLNGMTLEPARVFDLMRLALEVSLVLSEALDEEALWVSTDPDSIIVGDEESGRGFTFWVTPQRCLGGENTPNDLSRLIALGEDLAGWSNRLVSSQAGHGLAGWFKSLKENPQIGPRQALASLMALTAHAPTAAAASPAPPPTPTVAMPQPSSKAPFFLLGAVAFLVVGLALVYLHLRSKSAPVDEPLAKQEAPVTELDPEISDGGQHTKTEKPAALAPPKKAEPEEKFLRLVPDQIADMRQQKRGTLIELTGQLKSVNLTRNKAQINLQFEGAKGTAPILVIIPRKGYQGVFSVNFFRKFIGKTVRARGTSSLDRKKKCRDVLVTRSQDFVLHP
jgi:hypothetical protein